MREPLRHRRFRLLFLAQCASFLGDAVFIVAIAFAVLEVSGSAGSLGLVLACGSAALVLSFLVSGVWADRLPRVRLMVTSDLVRMLTQGVLAALLLTDAATVPLLIGLYVVYSIATAFFEPARTGLTPQLLQQELLMPANGLLGLARNATFIVGWACGGLLVAAVGAGGAIALDSASFAVSAALLLAIGHVPAGALVEDREPFLRELAGGWHELRSHRWLWFTVAVVTLWLLIWEAPMQVVGPLTMRAHYDGAASWGMLGAAQAFGAVLGAVAISTGRVTRAMRLVIPLFFVSVLMPILLVVSAPFAALLACNATIGLSFGMFDTVWHSAMQQRVAPDKLSRVSAWDWMGSLTGMPIGFAMAGVVTGAFGRGPMLVVMAAGGLVACVAIALEPSVRRLDQGLAYATGPSGRIVP